MSTRAEPDREAVTQEVGQLLRAARAKAGVTRRQLAAASGASERYLAHIESGAGNPTLEVLAALAKALDMPMVELLPVGGERNPAYAAATAAVRALPESRLAGLHAWLEGGPAPSSAAKGRRIALVGLRGAGKSSLGQRLAESLGSPFLEMSKEVERAYGADIGLLIELGGQSALRRQEELAWQAIVAGHEAAVIALPGGIVADAPLYNRILAEAHSIWLQAAPEDHMSRVMAQGDFRPMASNRGAMADLKAILAARSADYARAEARVDTSAADFERTAAVLQETAERLLRG